MRNPVATAIAIIFCLLILLGYFVPASYPALSFLKLLQVLLLQLAVPLAGTAALVAVIYLIRVHLRKLRAPKGRDLYSFVLIAAFLVTFITGVAFWQTNQRAEFLKVVTYIQTPIETSLLAVLAITLAYASLRLAQRRKDAMSVMFLLSVLVFLLLASGALSFLRDVPMLGGLLAFVERLPQAGARGILLGIGLGSLTTGLRILMGADRPYSG